MEAGFEVLYAQATPSVTHSLSLLLVNQDTELSAPSPAPCLPALLHVLHDDNGLNF